MSPDDRASRPGAIDARVADLMLRDEHRLGRRLDQARRQRDAKKRAELEDRIAQDVAHAEARVQSRRASVPPIIYPTELPITAKIDDIAAAIRDHQVVIVAGETGSGKTTQIPKICLELGRGIRGLIGHTQPRRLAARTVAERIATELGTELGDTVGYTVRFSDHVSDATLVKVMTDGILLAEIRRDRLLSAYDTLIIDEAHERSLNIDFILGYLEQLRDRRPDLKVIITSATIDTERFSKHFDDAPVVEVSGRGYPVEIRYEPLADDDEDTDRDQTQAVCDAVADLCTEGPGDILVFLSGEREIRDTAEALARSGLGETEVLALYARLSVAEQHRVFQAHPRRRVVLATNVAETSLTVPGIRFVVDAGTARISRYSHRTKVQRLPIEAISQASANQRAGRCGRVAPGICIRLYSQEDFEARPAFTDPEILRTNLASVILQMADIGLGDVAAFPFLDAPDARQIADGMALLFELGAFDPGQSDDQLRLTPLGRRLAQLPIDPRLARMVLEADRRDCAREVTIIAAALAIQDPRERPADHRGAADAAHARFADGDSDFVTYLNLWAYLTERQRELSSNQFRKLCRAEFLNYLRVREWQDLHSQLRRVGRDLGIRVNRDPAPRSALHLALLAGLLSHIGVRDGDTKDFRGARNARFTIAPGSSLAKKPPRWAMAAELVETTRLWARVAARIEPEWAEGLGDHLVKRTYSEPHWDPARGTAMAVERVTLYGVPIVTGRRVDYAGIDPEAAREMFIFHALVEREWDTHHRFYFDNGQLLSDAYALAERARRADVVVGDEELFHFYDQRVPPDVVSARHFDTWWKKKRSREPEWLSFTPAMLIKPSAADEVNALNYPDVWWQGDMELAVSYMFEPGSVSDGVTVHVPLPWLPRVRTTGFDWQIPGLRRELVTALIRSLPKDLRRGIVGVNGYVDAFLAQVDPDKAPLLETLERVLPTLTGDALPAGRWQLDRVPDYLKITFRVEDPSSGAVAGAGKDLVALQLRLQDLVRAGIATAVAGGTGIAAAVAGGPGVTGGDGVTGAGAAGAIAGVWRFGDLARSVEATWGGYRVTGYPALVDEGDQVGIGVFAGEAEQRGEMWAGTRRLLLEAIPIPLRHLARVVTNETKLALPHAPHLRLTDVFDDCIACALDRLVTEYGGPAWNKAGFDALAGAIQPLLLATVVDIVNQVGRAVAIARRIDRRLDDLASPALEPARRDIRAQVARLLYPGFVTAMGSWRLPDLMRYLDAIERRLDKLAVDPLRDRERQRRLEAVQRDFDEALIHLAPGKAADAGQLRWMIEELRVSLFAQTLGTPYPISEARIHRALDQLALPGAR